MNFVRSVTIAAATAGITAAGAFAGSASVFFGEDVQFGEQSDTRLPAIPNSSAAQADFLAGLVDPFVEDFESFSDGDTGSALENIDFGPSGDASIDQGEVFDIAERFPGQDTNGRGRYPISGDNYLELAPGGGNDITISFSQPINAFGFFGVDIGDFGGQLTSIVVTSMDGTETPYLVPHTLGSAGMDDGTTTGSVLFWGIIDVNNPIMSIRLSNDTPGTDGFAFDDFTVSSFPVIPTPTSVGLGLAGLMGLGAIRRRSA